MTTFNYTFDILKNRTLSQIETEFNQLRQYCENQIVMEFVSIILSPLLDKNTVELAKELSELVHQICGFDIYHAIINPLYVDVAYLEELNIFIETYVIEEDAAFNVKHGTLDKQWIAFSDFTGVRDLSVLIQCAKDNLIVIQNSHK